MTAIFLGLSDIFRDIKLISVLFCSLRQKKKILSSREINDL